MAIVTRSEDPRAKRQVNLCRSRTRLPVFVVIARPEAQNSQKHWNSPPLNFLKQSRSSPVKSITYLRHLLILATKFHPDLSTLRVSQDVQFPPPTPPPQCHKIWSRFKIRALRHEFLLNIKISLRSGDPFLSEKYFNFSNFSELTSPPNSPKESGLIPVV